MSHNVTVVLCCKTLLKVKLNQPEWQKGRHMGSELSYRPHWTGRHNLYTHGTLQRKGYNYVDGHDYGR